MPQEECRRCSILLTEENKVKRQRLCRSCNSVLCKEYKKKNKESISEYNKKYKKEHKSEIDIYNHNYNIINRKTIQERHTKYLKDKRQTDPNYKISVTCRNRIKKLIKGVHKTSTLIDCEKDLLMKWFEKNFSEGMTFENHGTFWHIDHVIPCKHFNLTDDKELKMCFHWSNLQPLKAEVNLSKKDKINKNEIKNHFLKVVDFCKKHKKQIKYNLSDYESCITTLNV